MSTQDEQVNSTLHNFIINPVDNTITSDTLSLGL